MNKEERKMNTEERKKNTEERKMNKEERKKNTEERKVKKVIDMDDHLYDSILNYAKCGLIPRFQKEYKNAQFLGKRMTDCASYPQIKALCVALNAIAPFAGYERVSPRNFV